MNYILHDLYLFFTDQRVDSVVRGRNNKTHETETNRRRGNSLIVISLCEARV